MPPPTPILRVRYPKTDVKGGRTPTKEMKTMTKYQDEYQKDEKELTSDFNEAKFQIYRLNNLWASIQLLFQLGDFTNIKWKLDSIWGELSADAREKDGYKKDYVGWVTEGIKNAKSYIFINKKLKLDIANSRTRHEMYQSLRELESFLRCLQDDVGKGAKRSSGDDDDIDS